MMRRRSPLRIDDSISRRRRVTMRQRTSISARAGSPSVDLIDITPELTGSLTLCGSLITMMQPADLGDCDDLALLLRFDLSRSRRVPLQCLMRARIVIIVQVIPQGSAQLIFTDDDQMIETFSANQADDAFRVWIWLHHQMHLKRTTHTEVSESFILSIHSPTASSSW